MSGRVLRQCQFCGEDFLAQRSDVERGSVKFCSRTCKFKHATLEASRPERIAARFQRMVDTNGPTPLHRPELGPCHVWTGARFPYGYGQLRVNRSGVPAHRVSWFLNTGSWPTLALLHRCDNPACVRFDHLFEGTKLDNSLDMSAKERGMNKLTSEQVQEILALRAGGMSLRKIAARYGVVKGTINFIAQGRTWKHVTKQHPR